MSRSIDFSALSTYPDPEEELFVGFLASLLTQPEARGLALGSDEAGEAQRQILCSKRSLRRIYELTYQKMLSAAARHGRSRGGVRVELGSGGGFFKEVAPGVLASDVRVLTGLDLVFDGRRLPFADGSVDEMFAMHVLHHIPDVRMFFAELERCLDPDGVLVCVEPFWSPFARFIYRHFHPEPFNDKEAAWEFRSTDPMMSNQALSYILLVRDREQFAREFPGLEVVRLEAFGGPSYILTGGIWKRQMLPTSWLHRIWAAEDRTWFWRRFLALHHLFVVRRTPAGAVEASATLP